MMRITSPSLRRTVAAAAAITALGGAGAGCGSSSPPHPASPAHATTAAAPRPPATPVSAAHVKIQNFGYSPASITVRAGAKVTFTNLDQTAHTATAKGSGFDTGTLGTGKSATVVLRRPGTYTYFCRFHPFMVGHIRVVR